MARLVYAGNGTGVVCERKTGAVVSAGVKRMSSNTTNMKQLWAGFSMKRTTTLRQLCLVGHFWAVLRRAVDCWAGRPWIVPSIRETQ